MNIVIDETTARMAVIAMRERADNLRRKAKGRRFTGAPYAHLRAQYRQNAARIDAHADALEAQYSNKARALGRQLRA